MASEIFNTISGYSVGIPPVTIVDANGNVVTNVLTTGNVAAGTIYSDDFRYANGVPLTLTPAGSNTEVQFNANGALGASSSFTFVTTSNLLTVANLAITGIASLGSASNVKIFGGTNGYVLKTDGLGNLSWGEGGGGGNGHPGGSNLQIQYNANGSFAGSPYLTFNPNTNILSAYHVTATAFTGDLSGTATYATIITGHSQPNITTLGTLTGLTVAGNIVAGNLSGANTIAANYFVGNGIALTSLPAGNLVGSVPLTEQVSQNNQPNITGVGTLTSLSLSGNLSGANIVSANYYYGNGVGLTYIPAANLVGTVPLAGHVTAPDQSNITSVGTLSNLVVSGNVSANYFAGSGAGLTYLPAANLVGSVPLAAHVTDGGQPNITSVGILTSLSVYGNIDAGNVRIGIGNLDAGNVNVVRKIAAESANLYGTLTLGESNTSLGNINAANTARIDLGSISNLHISGGNAGFTIVTDGAGNLRWAAGSGGEPGGGNTQVQFNNSGLFNGSPYFTYNDNTKTVQVGGNLIANSVQMGSGTYRWSRSEVYFATTASVSSNQVLYSIPAAGLAGVEFDIIATEPVSSRRQKCKISSLYYNEDVQYAEYASMIINGGVGSYNVYYNPGDVVNPATLQLRITPNTSRPTTYKMLVTVFSDG